MIKYLGAYLSGCLAAEIRCTNASGWNVFGPLPLSEVGNKALMAGKPPYANDGCKCDGVDNEITKFSYNIQKRLEGGVEPRQHPFEH